MDFFLKFDRNKYVPIGNYPNEGDAVQELQDPLYEKIIRARMRKRKNLFIIKRDMHKIKRDMLEIRTDMTEDLVEDRIYPWQAPLQIKEINGKLLVFIRGEFELEDLH